jgi:hypothetical protein
MRTVLGHKWKVIAGLLLMLAIAADLVAKRQASHGMLHPMSAEGHLSALNSDLFSAVGLGLACCGIAVWGWAGWHRERGIQSPVLVLLLIYATFSLLAV